MSSLSQVPADVLRLEARALRRLLAGSLWGLELHPVELAGDESPLLRAFWEEVGWDDELAEHVGPPQREANRLVAERLLADYRRSGGRLSPAVLPPRYRLVVPDADGVGFTISDESRGDLDPPVLGLSADEGAATPAGDSYLRLAAFQLVYAALNPWYRATLRTDPPLPDLARDQPLPHLVPGARRLSEDLWLFPNEADLPEPTDQVAIRSFDGLWRWLAGGQLRRVTIADLPGGARRLLVSPDAIRADTAGWSEVAGFPPVLGYRLGTLREAPVIVQLGAPCRLACSARHKEAIDAALAERGWVAG